MSVSAPAPLRLTGVTAGAGAAGAARTVQGMNEAHLRLCASPEWAAYVAGELLPWALARATLGGDVLELGPGPGRSTDVLRRQVTRLTAVEVDGALARALAARLAGSNVTVVHADATALPFPDARFSAATSFTMLHHVPTVPLQDRVLAEVRRVLRPGGLFVGADGTDTPERRALHADDVFLPCAPAGLRDRLAAAGFVVVSVEVRGDRFCFRATAPGLG